MKKNVKSLFAVIVAAVAELSSFEVKAFAPDETIKDFSIGPVTLMCRERNGWNVKFSREKSADGVEYAVVEMNRKTPDAPAAFDLSFNFPKRDIVGMWRPDATVSGFPMYWNIHNLPTIREFSFTYFLPLLSCMGSGGQNRVTFAVSESSEPVLVKGGIREENNCLYFSFHLYDRKISERTNFIAKLRIDTRDVFWSDAVIEASQWMTDSSGKEIANVPDDAFEPLYSTWYNFHQDVYQDEIERECALASKMGMKTIIVDDGWQTDDTNRGYAYCGDWKISTKRFPDFKAHVKRVQAMGMKYMLWYSVPFVGDASDVKKRFRGKFLRHDKVLKTNVLDPRFPDVREYLISIYENAVREWDIDGLKLDFIARFKGPSIPKGKSLNGRDYRSVTKATERLLSDIYKRLSAIKKDILIEYRQPYVGPSIRSGANMLRVGDCPADMQVNRLGIVNLRLTSGKTAVHSDMLEWHPTDTPEAAAKNVLSVIFSTVQYSMKLANLDKRHVDMIAHWSRFGKEHMEALQRGRFRAYHPELAYPLLEGEGKRERIFGVYASEIAVKTGTLDKKVFVLNSTDATSLVVEIPSSAKVVSYDTYGRKVESKDFVAGIYRMSVPASGYLEITAK
jgi:alpha-galactosidase